MGTPWREKNFIKLKHERYLDTFAFFSCANTPIFEEDGGGGKGKTRSFQLKK